MSDYPLSAKLWMRSMAQQTPNDALNTDFLQGIKNGNLHPEQYGRYIIQDGVYCEAAAESYTIVASKSVGPIREFTQARASSFRRFQNSIFESMHIKNSQGVILSDEAMKYIAFERDVAEKMEPLYFIVAMIPCYRLWPWCAKQLTSFATTDNVYKFWIETNVDDHGAVRIEEFLDNNCADLDVEKCWEIYNQAMKSEVAFLASATK